MKANIPKHMTNRKEYNRMIHKLKDEIDNFEFLQEGTKVKINYDEIKSRPNYDRLVDKYKEFIEENKDKIFTVEYDEKYKEKPYLVCLKEDDTPIKWLWHIVSDLIVIEK